MRSFVDSHWRDIVALAILSVGVVVSLTSPEAREGLGMPLVVAGLAILKLPTENGGNNASSTNPGTS